MTCLPVKLAMSLVKSAWRESRQIFYTKLRLQLQSMPPQLPNILRDTYYAYYYE